jgi:hypothetical protein
MPLQSMSLLSMWLQAVTLPDGAGAAEVLFLK